MGVHRYTVSAKLDSALPRDRVVNTLYFDHSGVLGPTDGMLDDLLAVFETGWYNSAVELVAKCYNIGAPPQFPLNERTKNPGATGTSNGPREVALCLSYYADRNLPRQRGRIFLPNYGSLAFTQVRPTVAQRDKALALATAFRNLGGADVHWVQYSPTDAQARGVTKAYVDDEWDTLRSRGLKPTTRTESAAFTD